MEELAKNTVGNILRRILLEKKHTSESRIALNKKIENFLFYKTILVTGGDAIFIHTDVPIAAIPNSLTEEERKLKERKRDINKSELKK